MSYKPTAQTIDQLLENLNEILSLEVVIPANWSSILFFEDAKNYPSLSREIFINTFREAQTGDMSYLDFFKKTRGYPRKDEQLEIWKIFDKGSIMLYLERYFVKVIYTGKEDKRILSICESLSELPIIHWNEVTKQAGAINYGFFCQDPEKYIKLFDRTTLTNLADWTDQEILEFLNVDLKNFCFSANVNSREELINWASKKLKI